MTALTSARRRYWRCQLFRMGFPSDVLDALILLRERYDAGRMCDGRAP